MLGKSWKTTLAGAIAGLALLAQGAELLPWMRLIAWTIAGLGAAAIGFLSRDNDKTSEDVRAPGAAKPIAASKGAIEIDPGADVEAIIKAIQEAMRPHRAPDPPVPGAPVAATDPQNTIPELSPPGREPQ